MDGVGFAQQLYGSLSMHEHLFDYVLVSSRAPLAF